jgi:hypothetical protein
VAAPNPIGEFIKFLLLQNLKKCSGCRRPNDPSNSDFGDWAVKTLPPFAIVIGAKCPPVSRPTSGPKSLSGRPAAPCTSSTESGWSSSRRRTAATTEGDLRLGRADQMVGQRKAEASTRGGAVFRSPCRAHEHRSVALRYLHA